MGFALAVLFLCLLLDEPLVGLLAALWMWLLAVVVAGLPPVTFGRILFRRGRLLDARDGRRGAQREHGRALVWHALGCSSRADWLSTSPGICIWRRISGLGRWAERQP